MVRTVKPNHSDPFGLYPPTATIPAADPNLKNITNNVYRDTSSATELIPELTLGDGDENDEAVNDPVFDKQERRVA